MRRTVSALNVRNRPKCHHGAPSDEIVRLRISGDGLAWIWIGGEMAPIECRTGDIVNLGGRRAATDVYGLARTIARRTRKRLVIVGE